jgi:DNA-directed RNA polymerase specialized sigma24 family protein
MVLDEVVDKIEARRACVVRWLRGIVGEADAEDVFQQALLIAMERADQLRDAERLGAWFDAIARRRGLDLLRARRPDGPLTEQPTRRVEPAPCPCVLKHLQELKPEHQEVLWLVEVQEHPVGEVARALHITPTNASMRLTRARAALRAVSLPCYGAHPLRDHDCVCL